MSSWKLKKAFGDLVYDLRNRGLLPVVVLLLVAIVAIPVVITRGGSSSAPIADAAALEEAAANAPEVQSAVVAYEHGLRKYQDRLSKLSAKDPFVQQFTPPPAGTSDSAAAADADAAGGTGSTDISDTTGTVDTTTGGGSKKKKGKKKSTTKYVSYQADVMVGDASLELAPLNNLAPLTQLPSPATPVMVYLGPNSGGQYGLFLVSNKVTELTGQGICVPAPDDCAMLALSPGQTEDLVYSGDGRTYRIQLVRLKRVVSSKPPA